MDCIFVWLFGCSYWEMSGTMLLRFDKLSAFPVIISFHGTSLQLLSLLSIHPFDSYNCLIWRFRATWYSPLGSGLVHCSTRMVLVFR